MTGMVLDFSAGPMVTTVKLPGFINVSKGFVHRITHILLRESVFGPRP